jgi:hypothetical protein
VQDGPSSASAAPGAAAVPSSGEPGAEVVAEPDAPSSEARDAAVAEPSGVAARPFAALPAGRAICGAGRGGGGGGGSAARRGGSAR